MTFKSDLAKKSSWPPVILTEIKKETAFKNLTLKIREIDVIVLMPATVSQNFQYETHAMTGNGNYVNLLKLVILTENKKKISNYMQ